MWEITATNSETHLGRDNDYLFLTGLISISENLFFIDNVFFSFGI